MCIMHIFGPVIFFNLKEPVPKTISIQAHLFLSPSLRLTHLFLLKDTCPKELFFFFVFYYSVRNPSFSFSVSFSSLLAHLLTSHLPFTLFTLFLVVCWTTDHTLCQLQKVTSEFALDVLIGKE